MKKTLTANISGTVFHIEEDAYEALNRYLANIRGKFSGSAGADEIIGDIESRIAELFTERLVGRQVVTLADVEHVIAVMGQPEDYVGDEAGQAAGAGAGAGAGTWAAAGGPRTRRLYRHPEDKWAGGVFGGIAAYFDTDPLWFRIAFILLVIFGVGSPLLIYIILWILVPVADTPAERLMMEGEPVTVDNLKRALEEGADRFKQGAERMAKEADAMGRRWSANAPRAGQRAATAVESTFQQLFAVLGKVIGAFLLLVGLALTLGLVTALITGGSITLGGLTPDQGLYALSGVVFDTAAQGFWAVCGAILLLLIPAIGIFLGGLKLVANVQVPRWLGWTLSTAWFAALIAVLVIGTSVLNDFRRSRMVRQEVAITQPAGQTLVLDALEPETGDRSWSVHYDDGRMDLELDELIVGDSLHLAAVSLDVEASPDSLFHLVAERRAHGVSTKVAVARAEHLGFRMQQSDSLVRVSPYLTLPLEDKFRAQRLRLVVQVPVGRAVHFNEAVGTVLYDVDNVTNTLDRDMLGRTWTMTSGGLSGSVTPEQVPDDLPAPKVPAVPEQPATPAEPTDDRPQAHLPNLFSGLTRMVRS